MSEELDTFSTMQLWEEPPFQSLLPLPEAELLFAADTGPPQFQSPSEFQSLPLHHPVWTGDENHILAANVGGNQQLQPQLPPLQAVFRQCASAGRCSRCDGGVMQIGYQQPQAQPEPVWSEDENKEFEMLITECRR
ncbi:hypothetical protein AAHE18_08G229800 [Arachis hypogaea]